MAFGRLRVPVIPARRALPQDPREMLEDLVKLPFTQKNIYCGPNWRAAQARPVRLDFPGSWQITFDLAKRQGKRVGFGSMLENSDFPEPGMAGFLLEKVPDISAQRPMEKEPIRDPLLESMPGYEHPAYQAAFRELNALLAAEFNGNPQIEYLDTMMDGYWGDAGLAKPRNGLRRLEAQSRAGGQGVRYSLN
jgi:hypothetical protein